MANPSATVTIETLRYRGSRFIALSTGRHSESRKKTQSAIALQTIEKD
jgi:hypothetical protein